MHKQRVLTGLVLSLVLLSGLLWGGVIFFNCLLFAISFFCLYEYFSMAFQGDRIFQTAGVLLGLMPVATSLFAPQGLNLSFSIFLQCTGCIIIILLTYGQHNDPFQQMTRFLFGILYIGLCASLIGLLYRLPNGNLWILFLFAVVAAADTGAYYTGKTIGKRKLCHAISKGKTVEGSIGGLAACMATALLSWLAFLRAVDPLTLVFIAALLGITSQIGDLAESVIKRACSIKDSGHILPGHGGVFDRVDGLLLAGPVLFWILYLSHGSSCFH